MTTSPSHLKVQKVVSKIWMQTEAAIRNDIFKKTMVLKNKIKNNLVVPLQVIVLIHAIK
jgi:hypothetical protein